MGADMRYGVLRYRIFFEGGYTETFVSDTAELVKFIDRPDFIRLEYLGEE